MSGQPSRISLLSPRRATGFLALGLIAFGSVRADDAPRLPPPTPSVIPSDKEPEGAVPKYDLETLRAMALKHNSAITAARASLASAVAGQQGVENIRVPTFLQPDLPIRRKQAALGVQAAEAGVRQAELLAVFGVQFTYVSYLYASEQERLATRAIEKLDKLTRSVKAVLEDKEVKTDLRVSDAIFLGSLQHFAAARLTETRSGSRRALSALREAVGAGCDAPLGISQTRLLDVRPTLDCKHLVEQALANRPELLLASINYQVTDLEVQAQKSRRSLNVRTFASGADLHANPLPAGQHDVEYRPGAIGPEMPPFLSGKQCDRVARATALLGRAGAVLERTRGLLTLEVEQAHLRYLETSNKVASLEMGATMLAKPVDERLKKLANAGFGDGSVPILDELMKYTQVLSQMRFQANEARYQQLIALITLERATGAAFRADLANAPAVKDE